MINMKTLSPHYFLASCVAVLFAVTAKAEDGLFSFVFEAAPTAKAGNKSVIVEAPIEKLNAPLVVASVSLNRIEEDKLYLLVLQPGKAIDFITPVLIDGDRATLGRMKEGGPGPVGQLLLFHFKEIKDARHWLKFVAKNFNINAAAIEDSTKEPEGL